MSISQSPEYRKRHFTVFPSLPPDGPPGDRWVGAWPFADDTVPDDLTGEQGYPGYPHGQGYFMGRFCLDRHKMAVNLGFVDSRVERVPLKELWTQKWHRRFIANPEISIQ